MNLTERKIIEIRIPRNSNSIVNDISSGTYTISYYQKIKGFFYKAKIQCSLIENESTTDRISVIFPNTILDDSYNQSYEYVIDGPNQRGLQRFQEYLTENDLSLGCDIQIKFIDFTIHSIDSKPIGNEIGLFMFLIKYFKIKHQIQDRKDIEFEKQ